MIQANGYEKTISIALQYDFLSLIVKINKQFLKVIKKENFHYLIDA